jgi:hypothetical protein
MTAFPREKSPKKLSRNCPAYTGTRPIASTLPSTIPAPVQNAGNKTRRSLNTPSWAEAQRIASDTLRGMDPEIAAARVVTKKTGSAANDRRRRLRSLDRPH